MAGLKMLVAAAVMSTISASSALAQEPAAFQAQYPNRDVLNGGELTPAGRMGLELPGGAAPSASAYPGAGRNAFSLQTPNGRLTQPATGKLIDFDGRRRSRAAPHRLRRN